MQHRLVYVLLLALLVVPLVLVLCGLHAMRENWRASAGQLRVGSREVLGGDGRATIVDHTTPRAGMRVTPGRFAASTAPRQGGRRATFRFRVDGDPGGRFTGAIEYSFNILAGVWASNHPVNVMVKFTPLDNQGLVLAAAGPTDFVALGNQSTLFAGTTAEAATGEQFNGEESVDVEVMVNSAVNWHTGTDANPDRFQTDFPSVFIHEIIHGLGFVGLLGVTGRRASFRREGPSRFDRFLGDGDGCSILTFSGQPNKLYQAVTNRFLYFVDDESNLIARLHAPPSFSTGSSVYHLSNNDFDGTEDDLQTPSLPPGYANHNIGAPTSTILALISDLSKNGAPICKQQRDPADAPKVSEGFLNQLFLGIPVWQFMIILACLSLILLLGTFAAASVASRRQRHVRLQPVESYLQRPPPVAQSWQLTSQQEPGVAATQFGSERFVSESFGQATSAQVSPRSYDPAGSGPFPPAI